MKGLAFDLYGTLVDVGGLEKAASKATNKPKDLVALWRSKQLEYTFLLGLMGRYLPFSEITARALDAACGSEGVDLKPAARDALVQSWRRLAPFPDVVPALERIRDRVPLAVLTNADPVMAAETLKTAALDRFFAEVLSADEVRTFKPNPRVYRLAAMRLHLDPRDIGLVSSNPFDVMGAKAAGLRAIWVNRGTSVFDPLDVKPDAELRDFSGLPNQL